MKITKRTKENTVKDLIRDYLDYCKIRGLSSKTIANYTHDLPYMIGDCESIDKDSINQYLLTLQERDLSVDTKNHYARALRAFVNWCHDNGYCEEIKIKAFKGQKPTVKLYSDEECIRLIAKEKNETFTQHRTRVMIAFILSTGARANTITNIKLSDVNFQSHYVVFSELKNKNVYHCPLTASIEKELRHYISTWSIPEDGYLFCNESGKKLNYSAFRLAFDRRCERLDVNARGVHALRHTFATSYIKNGGDVFSLSRQLTHASIQITQQYVHLANTDVAEKVSQFNMLDRLIQEKTTVRRRV